MADDIQFWRAGGRTLAGAKQADPRLASGGGKTMRFNALRNAMKETKDA